MAEDKLDGQSNIPGIIERVRRSIWRDPFPDDSRGRARQILNDLILHLHATKVPVRALAFTYSFGLGLLAILFFLVLITTGVLLLFVYTPTPEDAYASIQTLQTEIWMGQMVRNLHHWSGNALLIIAALHMLRVFYTAAFHPPREFNWLLGLSLLVLVALSNFTGYLLPWDQLAFWATTIVTGMIGYLPEIGDGLKQWLLGGPEVGAATLRTFFAFHIVVFPLFMAIIISYHIWRVRKDSFSLPRDLDEPPVNRRTLERVTTIPHLTDLELGGGLLVLALLIAWATWINAPLEPAANPSHPPNPAKAAWYFMGFQELLLHFHPLIVTLMIPGFTAAALIALPYMDRNPATEPDVEGIWFRSRRGRRLAVINTVLGVVITTGWVILDEKWLDLPKTFDFFPTVISNGLIPFGVILVVLIGYHWVLKRRGATLSERNLALFTLLCAAFLTLTVIGIFCRGENMALTFPW